jgi:hypothetical protein
MTDEEKNAALGCFFAAVCAVAERLRPKTQ